MEIQSFPGSNIPKGFPKEHFSAIIFDHVSSKLCELRSLGNGWTWREDFDSTDWQDLERSPEIPLEAVEPNVVIYWLVGQGHPSEKYDFVNWDDESNPIFLGK